MAQRGIQESLKEHRSVAFVFTLFTFYNGPIFENQRVHEFLRAHTCPPGPELLENDNSTNSFGIFPAAPANRVTQAEAFALSSSVKSSESDGGLGSPATPTALWTPKR